MSTGGLQRRARVAGEAWQVLLVGCVVAIWFVVVLTGTAEADDCLEYVKNARNLVAIPRGLLEDCMRTGVAQAILTGTIAGIGGGAIAAAIGKALSDAAKAEPKAPGPETPDYRQGREGPPKDNPFDPPPDLKRKKWEDEKLVWDPRDLGWRKPRPDEYPPPENPPEDSPPFATQNPRNQTPPECLALYDEYVRTQARLLELEPRIDKLNSDYRLAQDWLQLKLGIFTAQFAVDMTDFFQLGSGVIRAAGPISQAIGRAGSLPGMVRAAARRAADLARAVAALTQELAALGAKAAKLRTAAGVFREAAAVLGRHADELAEAVLAIDRRVAANRRLVAVAGELEGLLGERGAIVAKLVDAEKRLKAAETFWQRKQQLQRWAEGERVSITAEQARAALAAQAELDAMNDELRALSSRIAQSPEVTGAAVRTSKASSALSDIQERIRQLETHAQELSGKLEAMRKPFELKQAFLKAEDAREAAMAALDTIDSEIRGLNDELKQLGTSPATPALRERESAAFAEFEKAKQAFDYERGYFIDAQRQRARIENEADAARAARGEDAPFTPDELARTEQARRAEADARRLMQEARDTRAIRETDWENAKFALEEEVGRTHTRNAPEVERVKSAIAARQEARTTADARLDQARLDYDAAARNLQPYSHPGMGNVDRFPDLQEDLTLVRQELRSKRSEHAAARREFDEAYNAEAEVKARLEAESRPGLEARKTAAEDRLKQSNRSWQEVAAEESPAEFQQWKLEVEGTDPFNEAPGELAPLQEEVLSLRKQEDAIEKEITGRRDQVGSETRESLQRKIADDEGALASKRSEAEAAREKANAQRIEAEKGQKAAADAEAEYTAKEAELKQTQARQKEAEAEAASAGRDDPAPVEPNPGVGGGALDAIDQLAKRSRDLSNQVKPGWATGTEDVVRRAMGAFGEKWTKYFDGQSPEEVAEALKKSRDKVIRLRNELDAMTTQYDEVRARLHALKPQLDQCIREHSYWDAPAPTSSPTSPGA